MTKVALALLVATSGCLSRPSALSSDAGHDDSGSMHDDGQTATACWTHPFTGENMVALWSNAIKQPTERGDQRELWFVEHDADSRDHLHVAKRSGAGSIYMTEQAAFALQGNETEPALSGDGLSLFFLFASPTPEIYEARRSNLASTFFSVGPTGIPDQALSVSANPDATRLYFVDTNHDVRLAHRDTTQDVFTVETAVLFTGAAEISVSPDERELFVIPMGSTSFAQYLRPDIQPSTPFQTPVASLNIDIDRPSISADSQRLYFTPASNLMTVQQMTRTCP